MATAGVASSASINALRIRPCFQPSSKPKSLLSFSISTPSFLLLRSSSQSTPLSHPPSLPFLRSSNLRTKAAAAAAAPMASSSLPYERELAVAKKAASLAARLCQSTVVTTLLETPNYEWVESFSRNDDIFMDIELGLKIGKMGFLLSRFPISMLPECATEWTVQKALLQSDVQSKSDKSPVTVADYGSQALVSFVLEKELQSFSLVAEEDSGDLRKDESQETLKRITKLVNETISSDGGYNISPLSVEDVLTAIDRGQSEGGPHGQHWVLDPIDGTKGFLRGDQYAIALALLDEGRVVLGVLACPNLPLASIGCPHQPSLQNEVGCLFSARIGAGTDMQLLDGSSPPTKVYVTAIENPSEASFFESFEAAHSMHDLSSSIAKKLGVQAPPVRIDSQAKYGALSRGDGAIYLRFPHKGYREKIWDHAAGCIVVTEAGGVVTDAAGNPLDFSKGKYLDLERGIIVTNQKLMPVLLNAVQDAVREQSQAASTL